MSAATGTIGKTAAPSEVRAWARENGHTVGDRGKMPPAVIAAFNKAHPRRKYDEGKHVPLVKVTGVRQDKNGRKRAVTQNVNYTEVRAAAQAAGVPVGERGRIPSTVLSAFVAGPEALKALAAGS